MVASLIGEDSSYVSLLFNLFLLNAVVTTACKHEYINIHPRPRPFHQLSSLVMVLYLGNVFIIILGNRLLINIVLADLEPEIKGAGIRGIHEHQGFLDQ